MIPTPSRLVVVGAEVMMMLDLLGDLDRVEITKGRNSVR
jgi:hypothetical protein